MSTARLQCGTCRILDNKKFFFLIFFSTAFHLQLAHVSREASVPSMNDCVTNRAKLNYAPSLDLGSLSWRLYFDYYFRGGTPHHRIKKETMGSLLFNFLSLKITPYQIQSSSVLFFVQLGPKYIFHFLATGLWPTCCNESKLLKEFVKSKEKTKLCTQSGLTDTNNFGTHAVLVN